MALILTISSLIFLFGQMIVFTVADDVPSVLETKIITENDETISLKWVETEQFLANENLPIWTTTFSRHHLIKEKDIMQEIGAFKTYYDLEKSSAVVLIEKWNCLFGVIDVRYTIVCLELSKLSGHQHKVGESQHVINLSAPDVPNHDKILDLSKISTTNPNTGHDSSNKYLMLIKTYVNPNDNLLHHNLPHCRKAGYDRTVGTASTSMDDPPPHKKPRAYFHYKREVITVYPEILIFISHDVVRTANYLSTLVLRYIVQLNAVAMLFAKLETHNIKIHINIAGIIIDRNGHGFPPSELFLNNPRPESRVVLNSLADYIQHARDTIDFRRSLLPDDSFDMFLYSTTNEWREHEAYLGGVSTNVFDIRTQRILQRRTSHSQKKYLGSIIDYTHVMQHYVNAAREIAHLMTVKDDPPNQNLCLNDAQCHSIMQTGSQHCSNCLTWSQESIESFKIYLTTYMNRCYLRNLPRSLYPYGHPLKTLIPADQCLCFGNSPDLEALTHLINENTDKNESCERMMRCSSKDGSIIPHFTYPIDGTPCDTNDDNMVCWNTKCITTQGSLYGKYADLVHFGRTTSKMLRQK